MTAAIALAEVSFRYGARDILSGFALSVAPGEVVALLGPSGSGKSTVLRLVLGFAVPARGSVHLGDEIVSKDGKTLVPPEDRHLAVVFQDLALWPHLTVHANLAFGLGPGKRRGEHEARIRELLARVGLAGKEKHYPGELSGGERQRVAIARALVMEPRAILLDEPLSNLDVSLKRDLLGTFRELFKERKSTVVYVTHDLREAASLGDRIAVIEHGEVVQQGTLDLLRAQPASGF
ncbi:ABC transporter ATP-binding protein, partial [Myxococcota bacterium]|nr:ABC transporter ATP-binding protein [Myxococcota bacterium]